MVQINIGNIGNLTEKSRYSLKDLLNIMTILRSDNGCPWDKEQTHSSLKQSLLEESYEAVDAADNNDLIGLKEELGDILMLVALHSTIAKENNSFSFDDICDGICRKMILRHPHVFNNVKVNSTKEVLNNWEQIKKQEKKQTSHTDTLLAVPKALPALTKASKVQKRASTAGFDWDNIEGALQKVYEEADEVAKEIKKGNSKNASLELGDLLFAVVNLSRFLNQNPEDALNNATTKFINRFSKVEQKAIEKNINMQTASLQTLDLLWEEVKSEEK